jgi:hypothetical protein
MEIAQNRGLEIDHPAVDCDHCHLREVLSLRQTFRIMSS